MKKCKYTDVDMTDYLEMWKQEDMFTDFNLALDRGFLEYAIYLIDSGGAFSDDSMEENPIEKAMLKLIEGYDPKPDIDDMLKNTEVWIRADDNQVAFIPQVDVDYFVTQAELKDDGFEFDRGIDGNGEEYEQSRLEEE